ncbi:MAG: baseplate J/gp47 family protein [Nitrospira sp.]|nr:baseplate J/gp47 family protein [Nitrospira sp.]
MPIQLPNLDDRTYSELVEEARRLIPTYAPEWTNHNPSDPGITLIELFASITEMLMYRVNRVTDANRLAFLKLLNGPSWEAPDQTDPLFKTKMADAVRETVSAFRESNRAVTREDFERSALKADATIARTRCLPRRNLESGNARAGEIDEPGHVSVVIVPAGQGNTPQPTRELMQKVAADLEPRRLLTTRVHVVGPTYVTIRVRLTAVLTPDAIEDRFRFSLPSAVQADLDGRTLSGELRSRFEAVGMTLSPQTTISVQTAQSRWLITDGMTLRSYTVRKEVEASRQQLNVYEDVGRDQVVKSLRQFMHPLSGGRDGQGWPFGRNVYVSDIYALLDTLPGIDVVTKTVDPNTKNALDEFIVGVGDRDRLQYNETGDLSAVEIRSHELVNADVVPDDITLVLPKGAEPVTTHE